MVTVFGHIYSSTVTEHLFANHVATSHPSLAYGWTFKHHSIHQFALPYVTVLTLSHSIVILV